MKRFDALIKYFIWPMSDRVELARDIAARTKPRFIDIPRERRSNVPFTEEDAPAGAVCTTRR